MYILAKVKYKIFETANEGENEMREIKFRAWDKKEKKYIYLIGFYLFDNLYTLWFEDKKGLPNFIDISANRITIEQYIGLKDSTGKEIYEGDVLNTKTTFKNNMADRRYQDKTIIIVGFLSGCFVDLETGVSVSEKTKCIVYKKIDYEIIGNIHE